MNKTLLQLPGWAETLGQDVWYSWRRLRRAPGATAVAVVTLGLGIGAISGIFSLVNGVLLKPLPIPGLDRMVNVAVTDSGRAEPDRGLRTDVFRTLEGRNFDTLHSLTAVDHFRTIVSGPHSAHAVFAEAVTVNYFALCGVQPRLGRLLQPEDYRSTDSPLVISERLWRRAFKEEREVIGRTVYVSGRPRIVVGVTPEGFGGTGIPNMLGTDAWYPLDFATQTPELGLVQAFAGLGPGVSLSEADAEVRVVGQGIDPEKPSAGLALLPASRGMVPSKLRQVLLTAGSISIGLSGLVLLIACMNLANVLLATMTQRKGELALRVASGASRWRIVQLLLTETSLVTMLGGGLGCALTVGLARVSERIVLPEIGGTHLRYDVSPDWRVFVFAFVATLIAAAGVGVVPASRALKMDPQRALASAGGGYAATAPRAGQRRLMAAQVGASVVLLLVAGLFVRSTLAGLRQDPGFDVVHSAMGHFDLALQGYDEVRGRRTYRTVLEAAGTVPGVQHAALGTGLPWAREGSYHRMQAEDEPFSALDRGIGCRLLAVSPGYLDTIGLRLRNGRDFSPDDSASSRRVVIVSESAAARLWPGQDAIGKHLRWEARGRWQGLAEVIGVVPDTDRSSSDRAMLRTVLVPIEQNYSGRFLVVVRGRLDGERLVEPLRTAVERASSELAMFDASSVADHLGRVVLTARFAAVALLILAGVGLVIAVVGLYGVTAYLVSLRLREFGIMRALGATDQHLYETLLHDGLRVLLIGTSGGALAALCVAFLVRHVLFGIQPYDWLTFATVPAGLILVGLGAWLLPVRRAARADLAVALREL